MSCSLALTLSVTVLLDSKSTLVMTRCLGQLGQAELYSRYVDALDNLREEKKEVKRLEVLCQIYVFGLWIFVWIFFASFVA